MKETFCVKAMSMVLGLIIGVVSGLLISYKLFCKTADSLRKRIQKLEELYYVARVWVHNNTNKKRLAAFFELNNYNKVAIYGLNDLAFLLMDECEKNGIKIEYCIDINADAKVSKYKIYKPDEVLPKVDLIIVATVDQFELIKESLLQKYDWSVLSVLDVLLDIGKED